MATSRRRRNAPQAKQQQSNIPPPVSSSFAVGSGNPDHSLEASMLDQVPFLQDDWWTSSSAAGTDHSYSIDPVVDPFLHFPEEYENIPMSIYCGPSATTTPAAAVAAAAPMPKSTSPRRSSVKSPVSTALGVNANSKSISSRQSHILSERQRRKGMNHLFNTLAELLPENTPKGDKSTIVSQIISYIQSLQQELEELSKKQQSLQLKATLESASQSFSTASTVDSKAQNIGLSVSGPDAFVTMSGESSHSLLSRILTILQKHRLEVLNGSISSSGSKMFYYFHAKVPNGSEVPQDLVRLALQRLALERSASSASAVAST